jgi:hypothetical protein
VHIEMLLNCNLLGCIFAFFDISTPGLMLFVRGCCTVALRNGRSTIPIAYSRELVVPVRNVAFPQVLSSVSLAIQRGAVARMWRRETFGAILSWQAWNVENTA